MFNVVWINDWIKCLTRGLSAWQLRCLIIHWVWYIEQWTPNYLNLTSNATKGKMSRGKLKDHIWFTMCLWKNSCDAPFRSHVTFWSHVTLIRPWKFVQGQMSWGKLLVHRWFLMCVSLNYGQNVLSLWNIAHWKPNDLDLPFQFHQRSNVIHVINKVNWKAIYDLLYVFHTHFIWCTIYETQSLGRSVTLIWHLKVILANLDLSDLEKWPLEWFNQIQLCVVD